MFGGCSCTTAFILEENRSVMTLSPRSPLNFSLAGREISRSEPVALDCSRC